MLVCLVAIRSRSGDLSCFGVLVKGGVPVHHRVWTMIGDKRDKRDNRNKRQSLEVQNRGQSYEKIPAVHTQQETTWAKERDF